MMKKVISMIAMCWVITTQAQEVKNNWQSDVSAAIKESQLTKKPLLLFFTGSDWCGWCIKLQKEVFTQPEFVNWAKDNVILVEVDFPRNKKLPEPLQAQNASLQQVFQVQGFPTVWMVDVAEKDMKINFTPLAKSGYVAGGAQNWIDGIAKGLQNKQTKTN